MGSDGRGCAFITSRQSISYLVAAILLVATSSGALCRTWYVKADGTGDAPTIQAGVDSAAAGDTVLVAPGTYPQSTQRLVDGDTASVNVFIDHDVTLIAEGSPDNTTIDGSSGGVTVYVVSASAEIRGFEIVNRQQLFGCATALQAEDPQLLSADILEACVRCDSAGAWIVGNRLHGGYYAVHLKWSSLVTVANNEIYNAGAAISCMYGSDATVSENEIHGCAVGVECQASSSPSVLDNEIRNDAGNQSCWGVFSVFGSSPYVSGNHIRGMRNGGVFSNSGDPTVENNHIEFSLEGIRLGPCDGARIAGNLVNASGCGVNLFDAQNTVIESNSIVGSGSTGMSFFLGSGTVVRNNIVVASRGVECSGSSGLVFECNNVLAPQRYTGDCSDQTGTNGNISVDALFCDGANGDYTLSSNSPCAPGNHPDGYDCGVIGAYEVACPAETSSVTIATTPGGLEITIDDSAYAAPRAFMWEQGSTHSIGVSSPQSGGSGVQFVYSNWSDGGLQSHDVVVPGTDSTFTATFSTQYFLTMTAGPNGNVAPVSGWYDAGEQLQIQATPAYGHVFDAWAGQGNGSYTGSDNPATIIMNEPISQLAGFKPAPPVVTTITTSPSGLEITVDDSTYAAPHTFTWAPNSPHSIGVSSPQPGGPGIQYVYSNWSDGESQSHEIVAPGTDSTFTATFSTQYFLTMTSGPFGNLAPASGWHDAGEQLQIQATPATGYVFHAWTGVGNGSYTGSNNPATITMNEPISQIAQFNTAPNVTITMTTFPIGRQIIVDGTTWTATQRFTWQVGSTHTIGVPSPQDGDPGVRYIFSSWSDQGLQSHTVVTPSTNFAYNASFATRYYLTTVATGGSVTPAAGWWNAGQSLQIRATAEQGSEFVAWSGTGNGSYTGPDNPAFIAMYGPVTQTAEFKVIPAEFTLHQNYPNPFNPTTTIDFDLPEKSRVTLRVYDISGRVVQVLLDRVLMDAGEQSSGWDGTTSDGRSAPSGVYLCRIEAGPFSQTRRLVLLR